ncbi:MAG: hypothetical protein H0T91_03525 [Propionibacteriaceae bacterium]|nr:hypothetical protein [Propionibacteriaceae bacterium]
MFWVVVFAGIAVAGVIMVIGYGVWLFHKASDLMSEVRVLVDKLAELSELVSQVEVPRTPGGPDEARDLVAFMATRGSADGDVG